jgi:hypothetical protein
VSPELGDVGAALRHDFGEPDCLGTRRELAAALLVDVAGPDRSKVPATTLMLNRN